MEKLYNSPLPQFTKGTTLREISLVTQIREELVWWYGIEPDLIGTAGGVHDPPTFWYSVDREVFQRSKADFVHIDSPESYVTSNLYDPVHTDDPRLMGEKNK